jgi:hypothetical protein
MSGSLSVPFGIAAVLFNFDNEYAKPSLVVLAVLCFVSASYAVWRNERNTNLELIIKLEENKRRVAIKDKLGAGLEKVTSLMEECRKAGIDR